MNTSLAVGSNMNFIIKKLLGYGSQANIYLGKLMYSKEEVTDEKYYVCKLSKKFDEKTIELFNNDFEIVNFLCEQKSKSKYIVCYHYLVQDDENQIIMLIMDYFKGMALYDWIVKKPNIIDLNYDVIVENLLNAVYFLHSNGVIHRDLKPENIMYDGTNIKIIDFGLSCYATDLSCLKNLVGSINYIAPEILNGSSKDYGKSDIWALGMIIYILKYKSNIWETYPNNTKKLVKEIVEDETKPNLKLIKNDVNESTYELLYHMLNRDFTQRPSIDVLINIYKS